MGTKSTYQITRETALEIIHAKMDELSDREIEAILEVYPESDFRNYQICDEVFDSRSIESIDEFKNSSH